MKSKMFCMISSFILSVLCLIYYLGISFYAGFSISFGPFWLFLAICFAAFGLYCFYIRKHKNPFPKVLRRVIMVCICVGAFAFVVIEGILIYYGNATPTQNAEYVIVMGAKVHGETPSLALRKRLDATLDYAKKNEEAKLIVSGGQGAEETITEAEAMKRYLVERGVEESRIIKEEKATNTEENIRFSKELIESENSEIVVVSNGFHIFRCQRLAKKNGFTNVSGLGAPTPFGIHINNYTREAFALVKDLCVGNL